jgi:hypothetical protein
MATETKRTKALRTIVEPHLSLVMDRANELGITDKEFVHLTATQTGYVLVYYR